MEKLTAVLTMGGYGAYVWPAYAAAAIIVLAMVLSSLRGLKRAKRQLAELQGPVSDR